MQQLRKPLCPKGRDPQQEKPTRGNYRVAPPLHNHKKTLAQRQRPSTDKNNKEKLFLQSHFLLPQLINLTCAPCYKFKIQIQGDINLPVTHFPELPCTDSALNEQGTHCPQSCVGVLHFTTFVEA